MRLEPRPVGQDEPELRCPVCYAWLGAPKHGRYWMPELGLTVVVCPRLGFDRILASPAALGQLELETGDSPAGPVSLSTDPDRRQCPDGGTCHHSCTEACWRVGTCEPLSAAGWGDTWPSHVRREHLPEPELPWRHRRRPRARRS